MRPDVVAAARLAASNGISFVYEPTPIFFTIYSPIRTFCNAARGSMLLFGSHQRTELAGSLL